MDCWQPQQSPKVIKVLSKCANRPDCWSNRPRNPQIRTIFIDLLFVHFGNAAFEKRKKNIYNQKMAVLVGLLWTFQVCSSVVCFVLALVGVFGAGGTAAVLPGVLFGAHCRASASAGLRCCLLACVSIGRCVLVLGVSCCAG